MEKLIELKKKIEKDIQILKNVYDNLMEFYKCNTPKSAEILKELQQKQDFLKLINIIESKK